MIPTKIYVSSAGSLMRNAVKQRAVTFLTHDGVRSLHVTITCGPDKDASGGMTYE